MNINKCNDSDHDSFQLPIQQKKLQLSDHLKCGEVYTWLCEEELYAVECKLCEDRPMCPLSEFPQHMEVWHTDWEESVEGNDKQSQDHNEDPYKDEDQQFNDINDNLYLSFTTEDSGLYEEDEPQNEDHQHCKEGLQNVEEILKPLEQVLIQQYNNVDSSQINEHKNKEKTKEYLKKLTGTNEDKIVNDHQHKKDYKLQQLNINNSIKENCKQKVQSEELREYENLTTESNTKTKYQYKDIRENAKELRSHGDIIGKNKNSLTKDLEIKNYTERSENLNCEMKSEKISPGKQRIEKIGALEKVIPSKVKESEKQELMEISNLENLPFNPSNNTKISLRQSNIKLNETSFENLKNVKDCENSETIKEYLINKIKPAERVEKRKGKDSSKGKEKLENVVNKNINRTEEEKIADEVLSTNLKESQNYKKCSKNLSLRDKKRKIKLENCCGLEKSLYNNKEENICDSLGSNLIESLQSVKSNIIRRNSLLSKKTRKTKFSDRNKKLYDLENSLLANDEILSLNLEESQNSANDNWNVENFSLRAKTKKAKLASNDQAENLSDLEKILFINKEEIIMENTTPNLRARKIKTKENNFKDKLIETPANNINFCDLAKEANKPTNPNLILNKNYDTPTESCTKKKSSFFKNPRTISESSLDLEKNMSSLRVENLKSQQLKLLENVQEDLGDSENSSDKKKNSIDDSNTLTSTDINNLLTPISLENPLVSSYFLPDTLTSDHMNMDLNNRFDASITFNDQQLTSTTSPSSKTEKESKEKLTKHHILELIALYRENPRLWEHTHSEFCDSQLSRLSWQTITDKWNEYCKRKFTMTQVRIRICTLCQRYVKERERLELNGELDESSKFPYYKAMQFLELQKSLQTKRKLYEQQNEKLLEIYQHFPVLWQVGGLHLKQASERARAFQGISTALKLCGIQFSTLEVQKRIRSLRKLYRLEKIRFLNCQVEQIKFETTFKHFERMQFLDKHMDPFVCRICNKIFANLSGYSEHLDTENHGSTLEDDNENENENEFVVKDNNFKRINDSIIELEDTLITPTNEFDQLNSTPPKQTHLSYIETTLTSIPHINEVTLATTSSMLNEVLIYSANSAEQPIMNSLQLEDQIIEEIMENVTNNDTLSLDNFINSVTNCEAVTQNNCNNSETLAATVINMEYSNEIVIAETDMEVNPSYINANQEFQNQTDGEANKYNINENQELEMTSTGNNSPPPIKVKFQCVDYSLNLKLNTETPKMPAIINDPDIDTAEMDNIFSSLSNDDIRKMIALYCKYSQLWNPNHLDYNSRNLRRQTWCTLAAEYCKLLGRKLSWRTIHRKLMDYVKYYKKLIMEHKDYEEMEIKWIFYKDFKFLDDVIAVHDELQRSVHHRDNNFKIIEIYKYLPQLWDIKHPDFNKRSVKQSNIELMCYRLQEEYYLQITPERLKNRLIELRAQYRAAKKQRLKSVKNQQNYIHKFEFYEALLFIDQHIDPFICEQCNKEFKKLTDFNQHMRKEHEKKKVLRQTTLALTDPKEDNDDLLKNVCHICGIKFTTKSNLTNHLQRHDGIKNYECTLCTKKFFSSHSLKIHIRSHTKECPYTCEKCGASFVCGSKLNQHVKRHTNKKDFQCDYCPKAFFTAFEMDRHVRRHFNIRDKICPICDKSFVVGSSYYAHMMLHSDTKRYTCDKCDMKFAQYAGLYKHKKRHHKNF